MDCCRLFHLNTSIIMNCIFFFFVIIIQTSNIKTLKIHEIITKKSLNKIKMYTFVRNINKIILEKSYNVQSLF